jgi:LPXTG-site transpeptidase (sortase) family protein
VISSIGVDAPLEPVGILADGTMGVPTQRQWDGVGWYQDGPYPGDDGSAVIDGHLDRPGGAPAVFWNLSNLQVGDIVKVVGSDGYEDRFRVTRLAFYAPHDAPIKDIFENDSGTFLNLITCAGQWIPEQHQTTLRLVVYTELI